MLVERRNDAWQNGIKLILNIGKCVRFSAAMAGRNENFALQESWMFYF